MCGVIVPSVALTVCNRLFSPFTALSICLNTPADSPQITAQAGRRVSLGLLLGPRGAVALPVVIFPAPPFLHTQYAVPGAAFLALRPGDH